MQPLPRPSVTPLWSFASTPTVRRSPSFAETFSEVMRWLTGRPRPAFQTDRLREQRLVDEIAEQLDSLDINSVDSNP
jgi:hypothetical protein